MKKNVPLWQRGRYALAGLARALRGEASFRTEIGASVLGVALLLVTRAPVLWWAMLILLMAAILAAELLNTAIETLADRVNPEVDPLIGYAKDLGAAAVFVLSVAAILLAICLLWSFFHGAGGFAPPP
ncbi:diacylglycerol kinase [Acidithiobacillus sp. IBUN Pt1247-S3]|uniref:diacylglycerol kinase n=1 Tax=Acidithiobacillus sp. IBUN Pt1247-S3 TaxID=3166642 RepID=UPI0034E503B4